MSGAVCPKCGVAVVPGYVRCPKCHTALPARRAGTSPHEGGTALADKRRGTVIAAISAGVVGAVIIAIIGLRGGGHSTAAPAPTGSAAAVPETAESGNTATPEAPAEPPVLGTVTAPTGPNADDVAAELERSLKGKRLWSTVNVIGNHVDVRSSSCADPEMKGLIDDSVGSFKAAGLTRMRCIEQSGAVVFDRDL